MGFEQRVLEIVADELETSRCAEFRYGTLFMSSLSLHAAHRVFRRLINEGHYCRMTNMGDEWAIDFTAGPPREERLESALRVIVFMHREYLEANDPMALKQAEEALA
jgi:hypothetical protein